MYKIAVKHKKCKQTHNFNNEGIFIQKFVKLTGFTRLETKSKISLTVKFCYTCFFRSLHGLICLLFHHLSGWGTRIWPRATRRSENVKKIFSSLSWVGSELSRPDRPNTQLFWYRARLICLLWHSQSQPTRTRVSLTESPVQHENDEWNYKLDFRNLCRCNAVTLL